MELLALPKSNGRKMGKAKVQIRLWREQVQRPRLLGTFEKSMKMNQASQISFSFWGYFSKQNMSEGGESHPS